MHEFFQELLFVTNFPSYQQFFAITRLSNFRKILAGFLQTFVLCIVNDKDGSNFEQIHCLTDFTIRVITKGGHGTTDDLNNHRTESCFQKKKPFQHQQDIR